MKNIDEILEKHNELQRRLEKAEYYFDKTLNPDNKYLELYSQLLNEQSENFEKLYIFYEKSDVDRIVNSNKVLSLNDFKHCKHKIVVLDQGSNTKFNLGRSKHSSNFIPLTYKET